MDTLSFLQRVLPTVGIYVATVINTDRRRQGYFDSIEELAKAVQTLDAAGNNTYYALSSFKEKGSRKQDNVLLTKSIAFDVDCGDDKPYATWMDGLKALGQFVIDTQLPKPMVVHSGRGLHAYWVLSEELEPARWQPLAQGMKDLAAAHQFQIDPAVPADAARVLRPIGTHNLKNNAVVRLLLDSSGVAQITDIQKRVGVSSTAIMRTSLLQLPHTPKSKLSQDLVVQQDFPPVKAEIVQAKCAQIRWATTKQEEVPEPLWYAVIGVAAFCEDSDNTALQWSKDHPEFDAKETLRKLHQWQAQATGPSTCKKFEQERPIGCRGCKFKGRITAPTQLGVQHQEVGMAAGALNESAYEVAIPRPFKRTAKGIKMVIDDTDIDVCDFDLYPVAYGRDESLGYEVVRYHWNRPHKGWSELVMRQAYLAEGSREFPTSIADQGIVLRNKTQTETFQYMLRSYMNELRQKRAMTNLHTSMGWKEDFTEFVLGDLLLRKQADGSIAEEDISLSATTHRVGSELYQCEGSLEEWVKFTSILERGRLHGHMFALGVGFSSVLYAFTGLKGIVISLYGPTGGGKTLAQYWQQSIYGSPEKLHFAAKFTQNSLFARMGLQCHLPMTIDEVTMMDTKDVGDFAYWVSQGRDKARLTRTAEERAPKTWNAPTTVSTNTSMNSKLFASGLETDAQLARILEVNLDPVAAFSRDSTVGRKVYEFVNTNYGHAGRQFIHNLLQLGPEQIRTLIEQATSSFARRYKAKFSGQERYWEQAIILQDLASELAAQWGLIQYDYKLGTNWVLSQIGAVRQVIEENRSDAFDTLSEYLNQFMSETIVAYHTGSDKAVVDHSRLPRSEVRIRLDLYRASAGAPLTHGTILMDRVHLRRWLSERRVDYKTLIGDLTKENVLASPKSNKAYLAKDTPIKLAQSYVIGVNLSHPRLRGILEDADDAFEDLVFGQLKAVSPLSP
jgi:hypothetical protein